MLWWLFVDETDVRFHLYLDAIWTPYGLNYDQREIATAMIGLTDDACAWRDTRSFGKVLTFSRT